MDPEGKNFGRGIDVQTLVFYCFLFFFHLTPFLVIFTVNIYVFTVNIFSLDTVSGNIHCEYMFFLKYKQANKFIYVYFIESELQGFVGGLLTHVHFLLNLTCKFYVCI